MYAASARRSRRYLRNWSVTASASSTVAAASTLSATPLPGPLRSWPAKSIRRGAVQRILPLSGRWREVVDRRWTTASTALLCCRGASRDVGSQRLTCRGGNWSLDEEKLVDFEHGRARGGAAQRGSRSGAGSRRGPQGAAAVREIGHRRPDRARDDAGADRRRGRPANRDEAEARRAGFLVDHQTRAARGARIVQPGHRFHGRAGVAPATR